MNKFFSAFALLFLAAWGWAEPCDMAQQTPLRLMEQELQRSFKILKKQKPPIYYLSYTYTQGEENVLSVAYDGVSVLRSAPVSVAEVLARAGSPALDNTHALRGEQENWNVSMWSAPVADAADSKGFLAAWWNATQQAAETAQRDLSQVQSNVRSMADTRDKSDDFVFPPQENYCHSEPLQNIDLKPFVPRLKAASRLVLGKEYVLDASFAISVSQGHRYFADSRGTLLKTPYSFFRLSYQISGRSKDGLEISRDGIYDVSSADEFPTQEQLVADVAKSLSELEELSKAPEGTPYNAPTILKGRAAAVFVHEVMGHRLEGYRLKNADDGQTLSGKVGQQVISPLITITADPTQTEFKGEPLRGHYEYDDEGVKARPVVLIENGVLKNFLMQSSPIEGFPASNGHGRKQIGRRPEARMSVIRATASETVPYDKLEDMLLEEIKKQGKQYGFIVEDLGGGYTLTGTSLPQSFKLETKRVFKVYPDGRKEVVRGLDVVGTPLVSFNKIIAAGDDDTLFNGTCGASSGWVPQSNIAPSLLFENLEMEKTRKNDFKPPVLPAPDVKGGKK